MTIQIGGVCYRISSPDPVCLSAPTSYYRPFLDHPLPTVMPPVFDHRTTIRLEAAPRLDSLRLAFGTEGWSFFHSPSGLFFITHGLEGITHRLWTGHVSADYSESTFWPSEPVIQSVADGVTRLRQPLEYPIDQLMQMYILSRCEGLILHAMGAVIQGIGVLMAGPSGAGKTTLSRLLADRSPDAKILSDDRVIVRRSGVDWLLYGTPWPGDAGFAENGPVPLRRIFFPVKSLTNRTVPLDIHSALRRLLPVVSIPWYDREIVPLSLGLCEQLLQHCPCDELHVAPSPETAGWLMSLAAGAARSKC